jgi:hypothetical protein
MKKVFALFIVVLLAFLLAGCNRQIVDVTYHFNYAYVELPNGEVVEGKCQSWKDYEDDQLQVVIDGVTYLTHASRVVLMAGK